MVNCVKARSDDILRKHNSMVSESFQQTAEENCLTVQNLCPCLRNAKPRGAVELGKRLGPPGLWRPLHLERIASEIGRIPIILNGPYVNDLAPRLPGFAERHYIAARTVTRLFRKLSLCRGKGSFIRRDQSFWNRPRSKVLLAPERPSGVTEQDFDVVAPSPIEEEARALCL